MKKYKLTNQTIQWQGKTLYRIQALIDIPQHNVKAGDYGGFVESENNLSHEDDCWIADNAKVYESAHVFGNARVYGDAQVFGYARIYENAQVFGNARVYGDAQVFGYARVLDNARVYGNAWVYGNVNIQTGQFNNDNWKEQYQLNQNNDQYIINVLKRLHCTDEDIKRILGNE